MTSIINDVKYASLIAPYVRNYKKKNDYLFNFSCPICGDSSKNKLKARGYVYRSKQGLIYTCHNCGSSMNLGNLLKIISTSLYEDYVFENYKQGGAPRSSHKDENIAIPEMFRKASMLPVLPIRDSSLDSLISLDLLNEEHFAKQYVRKRRIPDQFLADLFFAENFKHFVNTVLPGKFDPIYDDHPRLIIPFLDVHGRMFAFQGRSFFNEEPKYFTIKLDESAERIFGLDRVDTSKTIYVLEGPIDSLFIDNAIAVSGSSIDSEVVEKLKSKSVIIFDNEPRNCEIMKLLRKAINRNFNVCIFPDSFEYKDINDAIQAGITKDEIKDIIDKNIFNGPAALLKFNSYHRCERIRRV